MVGAREKFEGTRKLCHEDLSYIGSVGPNVCKKLTDVGRHCSDPYWVSKSELKCNSKICTKPVGVVVKYEAAGSVCDSGLSCFDNPGQKLCEKPMD